jgi:hypothetical protein
MALDEYDEFFDDGEVSPEDWKSLSKTEKQEQRRKRQQTNKYEVGLAPPASDDLIAKREYYKEDYVRVHQELFKRSTGIKPFGPAQETSIRQTQHIIEHRGRAVIAEPRGFGKTSRTSNNCLIAVLQGRLRYAVILASSVSKAGEILESILTELVDNQELSELYPAVSRCFEKAQESMYATKYQTYGGEHTYIEIRKDRIRFPQIPGEPSSGSVIQVRPKDNVRGLFTKIRYGEESGRVLRPDFCFMDDIQTDEEADSLTSPRKIIKTIKKSVLFAGSHDKRISAVMCCTPIAPGDVASHFILNEPSWEVTLFKMVPKMPTNIETWLTDYREIYMNFNRFLPGDRLRAALDAKQYVIDNYDMLHEGSEVSWDWAYGWNEDPQVEVSALHHAINFLIEEGPEAFETECQCNVELKDTDGQEIKATTEEIIKKVSRFSRYHCAVDTQFITTHIDVNKEVLSYVTVASPQVLRPSIIDYGTWPKQPGSIWEKGKIMNSLQRMYSHTPELENQIYLGLVDLLANLTEMEYIKEDNSTLVHNLITVDMGWKIDEVQRAIRDSPHRHIIHPARGQGLTARVKEFGQRHYGPDCIVYHHCALVPSLDRQLMALYMDVNYFKTMFHKGIKSRSGIIRSIDLFVPAPGESHLLFGQHCVTESPFEDRNEAEGRSVIIWSPATNDNEYFDNSVGCLANLMKLGVKLSTSDNKPKKKMDMQEYMNQLKKG